MLSKRGYICIALAIGILLSRAMPDLWDALAKTSLRALFTSGYSTQHILLAEKLRTLFILISALFIVLIYRSQAIELIRQISRLKNKRWHLLSIAWLSLPGVIFYFIGIKAFMVSYYPMIFIGLVFTILLETSIFSLFFFGTYRLSFLRIPITFLLILIYECLVIAMALLMKSTGELDYKKYLGMIWAADLGFVLELTSLLLLLVYFSVILVIIAKFYQQKQLQNPKIKSLTISMWSMASIVFLLFFNPVILCGEVASLPHRSLQSHLLLTETNNVNRLVGGHVPELITSFFRRNRQNVVAHQVPEHLKETIAKNNLFPGRHQPERQGISPPFKRIILLTVESLSSEFTGLNKASCEKSITPNLDKLMSAYPSGSIWCNAFPTLYGLSAMFSSHPNANLVIDTGYPNSFVRQLRNSGYHTVFMRSAPEKFANEHVYFKQAGFETMIGRDYFQSELKMSQHISGWGLEDSYLYQAAVDFLDKNRDREKIFLHLLPADTHAPYGRKHYSNEYPAMPASGCRINNKRFLRSFFRQDHDIGRFYEALKENGLLDDETVFIITADHSSPRCYRPEPEVLAKIPIVIISERKISHLKLEDPSISQVDIAPTILDLANIKIPFGYYGQSLFRDTNRVYFGIHGGKVTVRNGGDMKIMDMRESRTGPADPLVELLRTIFVIPTQ